MAFMLNVSSVIVRCYPETSPWALRPHIFGVHPPDLSVYNTLANSRLRDAALAQAQRTGLNPFHFACWSNPFALDDSMLNKSLPPRAFDLPPIDTRPLPQLVFQPTLSTMLYIGEIQAKGACVVCRVQIGHATRVLKLYFGSQAEARFMAESEAYARFRHLKISTNSGAVVPECYGWTEVGPSFLRAMSTCHDASQSLREIVASHRAQSVKGILLEDLADAEVLSIDNITPEIADKVLKSLHTIHTAHVLHGTPFDRRNVLLLPAQQRAVWVGFSHSTSHPGPAAETELIGISAPISRQSLLDELSKGWTLLYQRLLPDSLIGFDAAQGEKIMDPADTDCLTLSPNPSSISIRPRPTSETVEQEIVSILGSYPEVNLFSWSPSIFNLVPVPKNDHRYDTEEFLQALISHARDTDPAGNSGNLFLYRWYGSCPTAVYDIDFFYEKAPLRFPGYAGPAPVPHLSSDMDIEFLEHIRPSSNHALMRVRIGSDVRVLKLFSKERRQGFHDRKTSKQRFEIERDAYAHLLHYGACASGAAPQCYGWLELSPTHVYDAIAIIRQTRERGYKRGEEPVWVTPIFEDGSFATALVLEYLPNAEAISISNITHSRAELALRALTHVHGSYIRHGDLKNPNNLLLVHEENDVERVVVIDYDVAETPQMEPEMVRFPILQELTHLWIYLFEQLLPQRRIHCNAPVHPHELDDI